MPQLYAPDSKCIKILFTFISALLFHVGALAADTDSLATIALSTDSLADKTAEFVCPRRIQIGSGYFELCNGLSKTLEASSQSGAVSFSWTSTDPNFGTPTTQSVTVTPPVGRWEHYVKGFDADGCEVTTQQISVVVAEKRVLNVTTSFNDECAGSQNYIRVAGGFRNYYCNGVEFFNQSLPVKPETTTTYQITATEYLGCTAAVSVTIDVKPKPVIAVTANSPTFSCRGESIDIGINGAVAYSWYDPYGLPHEFINNETVRVKPIGAVTYRLTGISEFGCRSTIDVPITVKELPEVTINAPDEACADVPFELSAEGAVSYTWEAGDGLGETTGSLVTATPTDPEGDREAVYNVTGTDAYGCTNTASEWVGIQRHELRMVVWASSPETCAGQSISIQALQGSGTTPYIWDNGITETTSLARVSPLVTTTYTVTNTSELGCVGRGSQTIVVDTPVITLSASDTEFCAGVTSTLTAEGAVQFTWSGPSISSRNGSSITASPSETAEYTVSGRNERGCTGTSSIILNVNHPAITVNTSDPDVCAGESATLTAGGGTSYIWDSNQTLSADNGEVVIATPLSTTTYRVTGTDANGCTQSQSVTVNAHSPTVILAGSNSICIGNNTSITASGADSYVWESNSTLDQLTGATVTATPLTNTVYSVTGTDVNGCIAEKSFSVVVNALPEIGLSATPEQVCAGSFTTISATGASSYKWDASSELSSTSGSSVVATPVTSAVYRVVGTDANGCVASNNIEITVNLPPFFTVSTNNDMICAGGSTTLSARGTTFYDWSPSDGLNTNSGQDVIASPGQTTTYSVTTYDGNGCTNTKTITVNVTQTPKPQITANGPTELCFGSTVLLTANGLLSNPAVYFDGNDAQMDFNRQISEDFTIEYWLKTTDRGNEGSQWFNGKGIVDGDVGGVNMDFGTSLLGSKLAFGIGGGYTQADHTIQSTSDINTGVWNHIAVTRSMSTKIVRIFINGVEEAAAIGNNPYALGTPTFLRVAGLASGGGGLRASIDELRVWNRERTGMEILDDMDKVLPEGTPSLVNYFRFEEGQGDWTVNQADQNQEARFSKSIDWTTRTSPKPADGNNTYSWNSGQTTSDIVAGEGEYVVYVTDAQGCSNYSDPVSISFSGSVPTSGLTSVSSEIARNESEYIVTADCELIARLESVGEESPVAGTVQGKVWIESVQPANYLKRHYEITPGTNASNATGRLTLYYTQQDFDDYNAVNSVKFPTWYGDEMNYANIFVDKISGVSSDGTGRPSSYLGTSMTIDRSELFVRWNQETALWEVNFNVNGFSGFFLKSQSTSLPVKLVSFSGKKTDTKKALLTWTTADEQDFAGFEIQKSVDAKSFERIGNVASKSLKDSYLTSYSFVDKYAAESVGYYRLKLMDNDGKFSYSKIISLTGDNEADFVGEFYPNPVVAEKVSVDVLAAAAGTYRVSVIDMLGIERAIMDVKVLSGQTKVQINTSDLRNGVNIVRFKQDNREFVRKLIRP
ncbi:LamG-like jellyroll fold domain-containing protein [Dyadobacter sp. CY347]|uniref:LamG-like jellyroll fold domain-containing protein n=1 Tax=Dyadobacter sp. CY347 TaxID=2909336 RepID=UPI001F37DDB3|nr:LamG-like jellyroll fold domain-containing protein [Dyadobacter sp. CY347]MCF2489118.1 T9SS type A sorting domain-containing protein [Dyadobacter sp. CY347]